MLLQIAIRYYLVHFGRKEGRGPQLSGYTKATPGQSFIFKPFLEYSKTLKTLYVYSKQTTYFRKENSLAVQSIQVPLGKKEYIITKIQSCWILVLRGLGFVQNMINFDKIIFFILFNNHFWYFSLFKI